MIALCVACGPSLVIEDIHLAKSYGCQIIAVNNVYEIYPDYDYHVACDKEFLQAHKQYLNPDKVWTSSTTIGRQLGCHVYHLDKKKPFNSGYLAIKVAQFLEFEKILLTGYDCDITEKMHYFGYHSCHDKLQDPNHLDVINWIKTFSTIKGDNIINCSRKSALTCFKKSNLLETLKRCDI